MIRINLLGQIRPRAARRMPSMQMDTGGATPVVFIGAGLVLGALVLGFFYYTWQKQLNDENVQIKRLQAQKADLEQTKLQVEAFEKQKVILQQRVATIEQLQRDRTGGQELLDMIANTVSRTENLWLTEMVRKGNTLSLEGSSASINSVAFANHLGQPEVFRPRDGIGDHVQQFLPASAVALQLLDRRHALLQNHFLLFEGFHLQLGLFQVCLLRLQPLDLGILIVQLFLPGVVEEPKNQGPENQSRANEHHGRHSSRVHRRHSTPCGPRSNLSKKVYANHG